jgi:hypothetical protein
LAGRERGRVGGKNCRCRNFVGLPSADMTRGLVQAGAASRGVRDGTTCPSPGMDDGGWRSEDDGDPGMMAAGLDWARG